jgi:hypothetical protein
VTTLFDKNDYRSLAKGETYENKFVILRQESLNEQYRTAEFQLFKAQSVFGCNPNKSGSKVLGYYASDKEEDGTRYENILGVATDESIARWEQLYGKKQSRKEG